MKKNIQLTKMTSPELEKELSELKTEFKVMLSGYGTEVPTDEIIEMELKSAIGAINRCRRFTPNGDKLYDELYEDKIIPLTLTAYLKQGAEGEKEHSENGIVRKYGNGNKYPREMLEDIAPLAKFY